MLVPLLIGGALADSPDPVLLERVHQRAVRLETRGMTVLGGWAALNIAGGLAGSLTASDDTSRAFHQGNAYWNVVNLGLAGAGLVGARRRASEAPQWPALPVELANQRSVFLLNFGLDFAYMSTGVALWKQPDNPTWRGYGQALFLQGAFLGVFDLSMALLNARNAAQLKPFLTGDTVGLAITF
jgi:hypothetical protein